MTDYSIYSGIVSATTLAIPETPIPLPDWQLFLLYPTIVFQARVNMATTFDVVDTITFDGVTLGAWGDIRPGQTVCFGSEPRARNYGMQRVRKQGTADTLYIGRSSTGSRIGEVTVIDNAYITVVDDYRIWAKIPYIREISDTEVEILKDSDLSVGTLTTNPPPVANTGPYFAGTIKDEGHAFDTVTVTLPIPGVTSFAVADGATIVSFAWDIEDGTFTDGTGATDDIITAYFPIGQRWVHLTVTDSNGQTHTSHVFILARSDDPVSDVVVPMWRLQSRNITQQGQRYNIEVDSDILAINCPDGTLVLIWSREPASPEDRSHMILIGRLDTELSRVTAQSTGIVRSTALNVVDGAGKLDLIPGFPISVANDTSRIVAKQPVITWSYMVNPTLFKYWHYLLQWHTTALDVMDWIRPTVGDEYTFVILGSEGESILNQLTRRAKVPAPNYMLTFNRAGQLAIIVDPMTQNLGDRTGVIQADITADDWTDVRYTAHVTPKIYWLRGKAILSDPTNVAAVFAHAPGLSPGQGVSAQDQSEQLVLSQQDLNDVTGHQYARINAEQSEFQITLVRDDDDFLDPWSDIEPAAMQWVTYTIPEEAATQRGIFFTEARGLPKELAINYTYSDTGTVCTPVLTWERETVGTPAVTYIPPSVAPLDSGFWPTPVVPVVPPTGPATDLYEGINYVALVGANQVSSFYSVHFYVTSDFQAATPTWTKTQFTVPRYPFTFVVDPFSPGYLTGEGAIHGWVATGDQIIYFRDIFGAQLKTIQYTFTGENVLEPGTGQSVWRTLGASFGEYFEEDAENPWLLCVWQVDHFGDPDTGIYSMYSLDAGVTWSTPTHITTNTDYISGTNELNMGLFMSPRTPGLAYIMSFITDGSPVGSGTLATAAGFKTTDWGATWSQITDSPVLDPGAGLGGDIHVPWPDNPDEDIVYYGRRTDVALGGPTNAKGNRLIRTNGGTETDISPVVDSRHYGPTAFTFSIRTYDSDRSYAVLTGLGDDEIDANRYYGVFVSIDEGDSWSEAISPIVSTSPHPLHTAFAGDSPNVLFSWGTLGWCRYSVDFGASWATKDTAAYTMSNISFLSLVGGVDPGSFEPSALAGIVVAYEPSQAADLASSYINIANPGTNDAAPGVDPDFFEFDGWQFDAATMYLTTGVVPTSTWSLVIGFVGGNWNEGTLAGNNEGTGKRFYVKPWIGGGAGTSEYGAGGIYMHSAGIPTNSNRDCIIITNQIAYHNGAPIGAIPNSWSGSIANGFLIGAAADAGGSPTDFSNGIVSSLYLYNRGLTPAEIENITIAVQGV